ncbi:hypothetical protein D8674_006208 [Pyrus ussuriensis x Pyrus communis]|uniref:Uncharacterized protein n=1 Tax=Pyrus ussuriensis x Pyrus communis TaxID=2448454 RepID=A0A5N5FY31_9ROSA|nr:hypothetical protein D8674_006208 [Pyrus ussuriensis x Pyrus communis]
MLLCYKSIAKPVRIGLPNSLTGDVSWPMVAQKHLAASDAAASISPASEGAASISQMIVQPPFSRNEGIVGISQCVTKIVAVVAGVRAVFVGRDNGVRWER